LPCRGYFIRDGSKLYHIRAEKSTVFFKNSFLRHYIGFFV
jgi:hypothetical protein